MHQYIREQLGVDFVSLYNENDADTQLNLMLAGGDYPDAIISKDSPVLDNYVQGGHILELEAWLKQYMPDYYTRVEENPGLFRSVVPGKEGGLYTLRFQFGYSEEYPAISPVLGMRYDIWKLLADNPADLPKPKDLDEFYDMAKAMVAAQPEYEGKKAYAFSGWFGDNWGGMWMLYAMQRFAGSNTWIGTAEKADNWKRKYCFDSDIWMYAMRLLNKAYREGIADPEAVTMNQDAYNQKLAQGLIYTTPYSGQWLDGLANAARAEAGHPEQKIFPYTWMKYPAHTGYTAPVVAGGASKGGIVGLYFTKNCEDAEEIIKRLGWMTTKEGIILQGMGVEGLHWNYDADGFRQPTEEVITAWLNEPLFREKTGIRLYECFGGYYGGFDEKGDAYVINENKYVIARQEDAADFEYKELLGLDPNLSVEFNAAKAGQYDDGADFPLDLKISGTPLQELETQLSDLEAEYISKLYLAKDDAEFDGLIAEWKQRAENLNYMEYYEHINPIIEAAYLEYLSTQK